MIMRWSPWYQEYRVVWYSWCYARIMGKDQAPCGHLMITTVLFIPSLIGSLDDDVMSEDGKWCMWWLRGNPEQSKLVDDNINLLHVVSSCSYVHAMLSWWSHDNSCLTCNCHAVVCLECFWLIVSLQVHSMYWPGMSCQFEGHAVIPWLLIVVSVRVS